MPTQFDPVKALQEEIVGLVGVIKALDTRVRHAEKVHAEAEVELNALVKLEGFARSELDRKREVVRQLVAERDGS